MNVERRKGPRYRVMEDEMIVLGCDSNTIAAVRDIGAGGMQLQYFPGQCESDQLSLVALVADNNRKILMADICCRLAYDIPHLIEAGTFSGMNVRLCGLCFGMLTEDQNTMLQHVLARFCVSKNGGC